jgi:hypothetical protein
MIVSSSILTADGGHGGSDNSGIGGTNNNGFEFGVDPGLDPELAMVSR